MGDVDAPRRHRVLLVDDVKGLRDLYRIILEREGRGRFEVVGEAPDGLEAIRLARETQPDLVVLDISMPGMDGLEALPRIRQASPRARVVVLSGFDGERLAEPALARGATAYVEKGVSPPELVERLFAALGERMPETQPSRPPPAPAPVAPREPSGPRADDPAALKREVAALRDANRELETFAYTVAHDLRAPLRGLGYFVTVLEEDAADDLDESAREVLRRMRAESDRLSQLIEGLLAFARVARMSIRRQRVDVTAMAEAVARDLHTSDPSRRVDFVIEPHLEATSDEPLLRLVLENLLQNAWKFTRHEDVARIEVGRTEPGEGAPAFFVRDNGAGFDQGSASRLFQPFQRLHSDADFRGTGVGLASVRRIVERHGGTVWAEGEVGVGATFYFTIPQSESADSPRARRRADAGRDRA